MQDGAWSMEDGAFRTRRFCSRYPTEPRSVLSVLSYM